MGNWLDRAGDGLHTIRSTKDTRRVDTSEASMALIRLRIDTTSSTDTDPSSIWIRLSTVSTTRDERADVRALAISARAERVGLSPARDLRSVLARVHRNGIVRTSAPSGHTESPRSSNKSDKTSIVCFDWKRDKLNFQEIRINSTKTRRQSSPSSPFVPVTSTYSSSASMRVGGTHWWSRMLTRYRAASADSGDRVSTAELASSATRNKTVGEGATPVLCTALTTAATIS